MSIYIYSLNPHISNVMISGLLFAYNRFFFCSDTWKYFTAFDLTAPELSPSLPVLFALIIHTDLLANSQLSKYNTVCVCMYYSQLELKKQQYAKSFLVAVCLVILASVLLGQHALTYYISVCWDMRISRKYFSYYFHLSRLWQLVVTFTYGT